MDIAYLLSLQSFRETSGQWLAPVMNYLSKFTDYLLLVVPIMVFWAFSREEGYWYVLNMGLANFVNNVVKLIFCTYRPWIRDSRIIPWGDSKKGATGYSFPSGHTAAAASVYGAVGCKQWKRRKWLSILMFLLVLVTGFSRNYLGVHTPQDVLVALAETALVILFNTWLMKHLHGDEKKQDIWTLIGFAVTVLGLIYMQFKSYPMDYVDGVLVVDPKDMLEDAYMAAGTLLGFFAGSLWERKKIHFDPSGTKKEKILRVIIGIIPVLLLYLVLRKPMMRLIGASWGALLSMFLLGLFVVGIYPWAIMKYKASRGK